MSGARIKQKLADGQTVFGTFFDFTTNARVAARLPDDGLDFVIVNTEHNAVHMGAYQGLPGALSRKNIACLVRIHTRDPQDVALVCDAYPDGVVVPYVEDVEEARRIVAAAKYRPLKGRALEQVITAGRWPSDQTRAYVEANCANTLCCLMIESVAAIENLDAICSIPGVDVVFVGPNDLSVSLGIPEQRDDPAFIAAIQKIIDVADRHGIAAGAHFRDLARAKELIEQGGRFIPVGNDGCMIEDGVQAFLAALKTN